MTKTAQKTIHFGAAHTYIAHIRECSPPPGGAAALYLAALKFPFAGMFRQNAN